MYQSAHAGCPLLPLDTGNVIGVSVKPKNRCYINLLQMCQSSRRLCQQVVLYVIVSCYRREMENVMLKILLVKIEPVNISRVINPKENNDKFSLNVSGGESLEFTVNKCHYSADNSFVALRENNNNISVYLIDKYPERYYKHGAYVDTNCTSSIFRYEVECLSKDEISMNYDHTILICPDYEAIVLANLDFACHWETNIIRNPTKILFCNDNFLSVKTMFGAFRYINLSDYNQFALNPEAPNKYYGLKVESIRCSDAVLSDFLLTGTVNEGCVPDTYY